MAYAPHIRIAFGGALDIGQSQLEQWVCTINAVPAGGSIGDFGYAAYLNGMHDDLRDWFIAPGHWLSASASLEYVKANPIGPDGKYLDATSSFFFDYPGDTVKGGAAQTEPSIISTATTWTTAIKRGPGTRGRVYLPNGTSSPSQSPTISADFQGYVLAAGKALLDVIESTGAGKLPVIPVVASKVNATNTPITGVSVGSVKDVQRRRKDQIVETYLSSPWSS